MNPFSFIFSDKSQLLPAGTVHSSTGTYFSANSLFKLVETSFLSTGNVFLFRDFFCKWKPLLKLESETIFLLVNKYFQRFEDFVKWKQLFRVVATHFSTNPLSGWWTRIFCLVKTVFFY